jgi:hypothetical protein
VDPVPDPLLLRKSGSAGDRTRDLCICSQKLWPLDHRGGQPLDHPKRNETNPIMPQNSIILRCTLILSSTYSQVFQLVISYQQFPIESLFAFCISPNPTIRPYYLSWVDRPWHHFLHLQATYLLLGPNFPLRTLLKHPRHVPLPCYTTWGTALQARMSPVRFPLGSLRFFIEVIFRPHYGRGIDSASDRNEYQGYLLGGKGSRCVDLKFCPVHVPMTWVFWEILAQPPGDLKACPGLQR